MPLYRRMKRRSLLPLVVIPHEAGSKELDVAKVFVDDKHASVVALGVGKKHEKAGFMRVIGFRRPDKRFSVAEGGFDLATAL